MTISILGKQNEHNNQLSKSSAAYVRWRDGIWYHAKVDSLHNNLYNVRFCGWYGLDSKGVYDGSCIVADNNNKICSCKKGHTSSEVSNLTSRVQKKEKEKTPKRVKTENSPSSSSSNATTTTATSPPPANNTPLNYSLRKRVSYNPYSSDFYTPTKTSRLPLTKSNSSSNIINNDTNNNNTNNNSTDTSNSNNNIIINSDSSNSPSQTLSSPLPDLVTPQSSPPIAKLDLDFSSIPTPKEEKPKETTKEKEKGKKKKVIRSLQL
eukprot:TRINITY_DN4735_c0_g1_i5.p1 TRINITY_DN4735_c0_g1~~TRINITY_DN4735_c0_g1_i5.p1  ORF type:complete len:264 (-),score=88.05 TRINITY_DN4735_c0_g1_i5:75-866(-)